MNYSNCQFKFKPKEVEKTCPVNLCLHGIFINDLFFSYFTFFSFFFRNETHLNPIQRNR